jgi:regulation of enolase protein 1 (concanavalin A-like superfamily)
MDTANSKNRKFKRMFLHILSILFILAMAFPVAGSVYAQEPAPWLRAHPEWESVDGWYWPLGAQLQLTVDDPNTAESPDLTMSKTVDVVTEPPDNNSVWFDFAGVYDLKAGDVVTLTDGTTTRSLVVSVLSINAVDIETNIITGIAEPGSAIRLPVPGEVFASANDDGLWEANFAEAGFDLVAGTTFIAELYDDDGDLTSFEEYVPLPIWRDEFDSDALDPSWYWKNGDSGEWSLAENPGFLRMKVSNTQAADANMLLRPVAQGDFVIKTHVIFEPNSNFQFAGLIIYQDDQNDLAFGRAFCDIEGACVGNGLYFDYVAGGNWIDGNFGTQVNSPNEAYLRLERRGEMVKAFYSYEGFTWYEIGTHWISPDFQVNGVGLLAAGDYDNVNVTADFDFFELTEGWGFLPEGYHDYDQGDVPNWACNAGGWAADPDNRAADVNVDIVVDDQTVASLVAGEFRQDLADAGVCVDGNCSFSTSLWDVISSYEPHKVDVWAQDDTGDWVLLSNSAKTLTCRTYDIYTFDPVTGTTKQITNLRDKQEYNPRWSPDGKKIVHDAWSIDWSSHNVYITDVQSGVSTLLAGAESGSYPTWAPNDKWIAFDRGADNDYRLFIVPPTGGNPKLVRDDAFMASWAPNSQRLAFHQPSDGSIRTMNLNGENVTLVAERGNGPAWSPDGEWIAFEVDGDVWKVRVNNNGGPLGGPIRLTSSPAWEGRPTWSYDSKTIAFHAGMGQDADIWTIPAAGGTPTWLTGAPIFGDYDANYSLKGQSQYISYSSFSPDGQAARQWVAAYTYDYGTWSEGDHSYHFEAVWNGGSETTNDISFNVSGEAQAYDGYVLLRPGAVRAGADCAAVDAILPNQFTRFLSGYVTDYPRTYSEAQAYFDSLSASAVWDDGQSAELVRHEIFPFREDNWFNYVCTFTADLILDANQPDWVNSGIIVSTGQSFTIEAFGLMNPCSDTYPNGADYCIFYTPMGAEGVVPDENEFGIFPGPGLPFMALLGRIGDGEPFYVGAGGIFTAEQSGTLWFTPNDNLRTDNQGAYSVLVWLKPQE